MLSREDGDLFREYHQAMHEENFLGKVKKEERVRKNKEVKEEESKSGERGGGRKGKG